MEHWFPSRQIEAGVDKWRLPFWGNRYLKRRLHAQCYPQLQNMSYLRDMESKKSSLTLSTPTTSCLGCRHFIHWLQLLTLKEAFTRTFERGRMKYGLYALFLKNGISCSIKYGGKRDYQEGTVVSFSPGQTVEVDMIPGNPVHDVNWDCYFIPISSLVRHLPTRSMSSVF